MPTKAKTARGAITPRTGPAMHDHLSPVAALQAAWNGPGAHPDHHQAMRLQIQRYITERMPLVARSLERVVTAEHTDDTQAIIDAMVAIGSQSHFDREAAWREGYETAVVELLASVLERSRRAKHTHGTEIARQLLDSERKGQR